MNSSPNRFPISTRTLQGVLPHRPPMVWIDSVESADETCGNCTVILSKDGPQCSPLGLRQSTLIEWLAQGSGFCQAAILKSAVKTAYLVSVNQFEYCTQPIWSAFQKKLSNTNSITLTIKTKLLRTLGPITLCSGEVFDGDILLGKGTFKAFTAIGE